jgi:hypothetical protein
MILQLLKESSQNNGSQPSLMIVDPSFVWVSHTIEVGNFCLKHFIDYGLFGEAGLSGKSVENGTCKYQFSISSSKVLTICLEEIAVDPPYTGLLFPNQWFDLWLGFFFG